MIEKYFKENKNINSDYINNSCLPKSKLYLKILGLLYTLDNTNLPITPEIIEVIKESHIFNVILILKPWIIRVSSKSDMAMVWINIWDSQNGSKAKSIINQWFNIGQYITIVYGININPRVLQYKNCWKWSYSTLAYWAHRSRCVKCNGPHNTEHHRKIAWCCKENLKTNPPRFKMKKGEPCSHVFMCINCKGSTKQTAILIHSRKTVWTRIGTVKSNRSSMKVE